MILLVSESVQKPTKVLNKQKNGLNASPQQAVSEEIILIRFIFVMEPQRNPADETKSQSMKSELSLLQSPHGTSFHAFIQHFLRHIMCTVCIQRGAG